MRGKSWHNSDTIVETKGQQTFFYKGPDSKYFRLPGLLLLLKQASTEIDDPLYLRRLSQGVSRGS